MYEMVALIGLMILTFLVLSYFGWQWLNYHAKLSYDHWNRAIDWMHFMAEEIGMITSDNLEPLSITEAEVRNEIDSPCDISIDSILEIEYIHETGQRIQHAECEIYEAHNRLYSPFVFIVLLWLFMWGEIAPTEVRPYGPKLKSS